MQLTKQKKITALFFIKKTEFGTRRYISSNECIKPERTKNYKELEALFNEGKIYSYGYEFDLPSFY